MNMMQQTHVYPQHHQSIYQPQPSFQPQYYYSQPYLKEQTYVEESPIVPQQLHKKSSPISPTEQQIYADRKLSNNEDSGGN